MNPKKPDQIRSMIASVGTEPGRVNRDVTSVSPSAILKTAKGLEKITDLHDTIIDNMT